MKNNKKISIIILIICFLFYAFVFYFAIKEINKDNQYRPVENIDYSEMTFEELLDETFLQLTKITSE